MASYLYAGLSTVVNTTLTYAINHLPQRGTAAPKQPTVIPTELRPTAPEAPKESSLKSAVVVQPKEETAEEKLVAKQKEFEKFMADFGVPINFIGALHGPLNNNTLTLQTVQELVANAQGWNSFQRYDVESQAQSHFDKLKSLRQHMIGFKDKPVIWDNFEPWAIFKMLASKIWEGTEKQAELIEVLKHKVLHAPEMTSRGSACLIPNVFISTFTYKLFFDNVDFKAFNPDEKRAVFKTLYLSLLIDPKFAEYLEKTQKENPETIQTLIIHGIESLLERQEHSRLDFTMHLMTHSSLDDDYEEAAQLAGFCAGIYNQRPNDSLAQRIGAELSKAKSFTAFGPIFQHNYEIAKARMDLRQKVYQETANTTDMNLLILQHRFDMSFFGPSKYFPGGYLVQINLPSQALELIIKILKENPQLLKAINLQDLLNLSDHFSAEDLQNAVRAQIKQAKSMHGTLQAYATDAERTKLEKKLTLTLLLELRLKDPNLG